MSTVNAVTIYAENLQGANLVVGNTSSNLTVTANSIAISIGNVTVNSTAIKVVSPASSSQNTTINTTSLAANTLKLNGIDYNGIIGDTVLVDYQVFTNPAVANFWYKPAWAQANDIVTIQMWGGGGAGSTGGSQVGGGGGGACVIVNKLASECNSVCNVIVGSGGVYVSSGINSASGQSSIFWTNSSFSITSYQGSGTFANATTVVAGRGGGWFSEGIINGNGGGPLGTTGSSTFGGGGGGSAFSTDSSGGVSVYGGGGGGKGTGNGGRSLYGGGGGAATGAIGSSVFGGSGGNSTVAATAPGGGGGVNANGARGEVRVWVTGQARQAGDQLPYYFITPNTSSVVENSAVSFTVSTVNVANGTTLYYTLNNSSTATSADFTGAVNGSVVINGGSNTFTLTANNDTDTTETFYMDLRTGSSTGAIVANSSTVSITQFITGADIIFFANTTTGDTVSTLNMPAGLQQNDLVIISQVGDNAMGATPAGWTDITFSGTASISNFKTFYKFMGSTPDASVTLPTSTGVSIAYAIRNANTTFLDGTASYSAVGSADAPSITTTKANSYVVAVISGFSGFGSIAGAPTGYTQVANVSNASEGILVAYKKVVSAGVENPADVVVSADSEGAVTFAIKNNV